LRIRQAFTFDARGLSNQDKPRDSFAQSALAADEAIADGPC
jgi:hypothetical protein